ncbi:hypothetical protein [Mesorhizobium sp.]|uniref:hypothetical protein n=1 Tax=Mesorhizobium sp. TaxID=1871066 RepID=UPI000FE914AC|nr:hypothetical protein [Mesorhizobium sp.]RWN60186.1 MAG: hypothetical protein EOS00_16720 [Mesorhizobium sp.]
MNVEDGDELPIRVTFECLSGDYWNCQLAVMPHVGDTVVIASAPKGTEHVVHRIIHHVGGANHRIVIKVSRI